MRNLARRPSNDNHEAQRMTMMVQPPSSSSSFGGNTRRRWSSSQLVFWRRIWMLSLLLVQHHQQHKLLFHGAVAAFGSTSVVTSKSTTQRQQQHLSSSSSDKEIVSTAQAAYRSRLAAIPRVLPCNHQIHCCRRRSRRPFITTSTISAETVMFATIERDDGDDSIVDNKLPNSAADQSVVAPEEQNAAAASWLQPQQQQQQLLRPQQSCDVDQMSGSDLAYIGDVVYELYIRSKMVWPPLRTAQRQEQAVALVRAEYQSQLLSHLRNEFGLTLLEEQVLKRGRNASRNHNHKRNPAIYQDSTAFEALLGYLYISNPSRCDEILQWIDTKMDDHVQ